MRAKGYSDVEAADRILVQQVRRESQKKTPKDTPCPESAAALSLLALSSTANVGRLTLATITPVPVAVSILLAAGVAALPSPPRKTQKRRIRSRSRGRTSRSAGPSRDRHMRAESRYAAQIGPAIPVKKFNYTTINRWIPLWLTNQTWDGKAALFVATNNRGKIRPFGGGEGMVNARRWPISMGPPTCTPQTHHNQPWLGWVGVESARGWRSDCVLW
jgi:hypothetical protein